MLMLSLSILVSHRKGYGFYEWVAYTLKSAEGGMTVAKKPQISFQRETWREQILSYRNMFDGGIGSLTSSRGSSFPEASASQSRNASRIMAWLTPPFFLIVCSSASLSLTLKRSTTLRTASTTMNAFKVGSRHACFNIVR